MDEELQYVKDQYVDRLPPEFDWESAVSVFAEADEDEQASLWKQADTALEVRNLFGRMHRQARREALRAFAGEVRRSTTTLAKYARTAEFFPAEVIPAEKYAGRHFDVPFSLYRVAANHTTNGKAARAALQEALDNDWKVADLQKELVRRNSLKLTGELDILDNILYLGDMPLSHIPDVAAFKGLRVRFRIEIVPDEEE